MRLVQEAGFHTARVRTSAFPNFEIPRKGSHGVSVSGRDKDHLGKGFPFEETTTVSNPGPPGLLTRFPSTSYLAIVAVVSGLHVSAAKVARVDESVLALVVKLDQHGHGGKLGSPQGRKFVMFLSGQCQERVSSVHHIAVHQ